MNQLDHFVKANKVIVNFVSDAIPGVIDSYTGTLDHATARFHTILLKLSQQPLLLDEKYPEVQECFDAIQSFYYFTQKFLTWPYFMKPVAKFMLYIIGTRRIPKIKKLYQTLNN